MTEENKNIADILFETYFINKTKNKNLDMDINYEAIIEFTSKMRVMTISTLTHLQFENIPKLINNYSNFCSAIHPDSLTGWQPWSMPRVHLDWIYLCES